MSPRHRSPNDLARESTALRARAGRDRRVRVSPLTKIRVNLDALPAA